MKIGVQLNPQVSIDKPPESLMPTLIEQVRVADQSGFQAFSMGEHYNIPGVTARAPDSRPWLASAPR